MGFSESNGHSNSNSFWCTAVDSPKVRSLPLIFRYGIPGFQAGWPPPC